MLLRVLSADDSKLSTSAQLTSVEGMGSLQGHTCLPGGNSLLVTVNIDSTKP